VTDAFASVLIHSEWLVRSLHGKGPRNNRVGLIVNDTKDTIFGEKSLPSHNSENRLTNVTAVVTERCNSKFKVGGLYFT
jgi:hypothetical protein